MYTYEGKIIQKILKSGNVKVGQKGLFSLDIGMEFYLYLHLSQDI
jgi:hypothetical protein